MIQQVQTTNTKNQQNIKQFQNVIMKYVDELIEKTKENSKGGIYWVDFYEEMNNFLDGNYSEEDKNKLKQKGRLEKVGMLYEGYKKEVKKIYYRKDTL